MNLLAGADVSVKRNFNEDDDNEDTHPGVYTQKSDNVVTLYENGRLYEIDTDFMLNTINRISIDVMIGEFRQSIEQEMVLK